MGRTTHDDAGRCRRAVSTCYDAACKPPFCSPQLGRIHTDRVSFCCAVQQEHGCVPSKPVGLRLPSTLQVTLSFAHLHLRKRFAAQEGCKSMSKLCWHEACHCRVGIELPSVEVRFRDLTVEAQAEAAGRELPSIFNSYRNSVEVTRSPVLLSGFWLDTQSGILPLIHFAVAGHPYGCGCLCTVINHPVILTAYKSPSLASEVYRLAHWPRYFTKNHCSDMMRAWPAVLMMQQPSSFTMLRIRQKKYHTRGLPDIHDLRSEERGARSAFLFWFMPYLARVWIAEALGECHQGSA